MEWKENGSSLRFLEERHHPFKAEQKLRLHAIDAGVLVYAPTLLRNETSFCNDLRSCRGGEGSSKCEQVLGNLVAVRLCVRERSIPQTQ